VSAETAEEAQLDFDLSLIRRVARGEITLAEAEKLLAERNKEGAKA